MKELQAVAGLVAVIGNREILSALISRRTACPTVFFELYE
jgi:hypothetical protein